MNATDNTQLAVQFVKDVNERKLDAVAALMAPEFVARWAGRPEVRGAAAWIAAVQAILAGVPDLTYTVDAMAAEGDLVAMRYHWTGTQSGTLRGIPPSGKPLRLEGMGFFRFQDGRLVEEWAVDDTLGLLQQLGVVPAAG